MSKFLLNLLLQIFQALVNSKSNFYSKGIIPRIPPTRPIRPADFPGLGLPTGPTLPGPNRQPTRPLSRPARACLWHILQKTFSSLIHAFRPRRLLSLPSLTRGPCLSALSSIPRWPTPIAPPPSPAASGLSGPPLLTSRCRLSRYSPHNHFPLFKSRLNPP
jgi:hypothetical protein